MLTPKAILYFISFLLLRLTSWAQDADPYLSKFFAVQVDETVYVRWTINAGSTCNDTYIERSEDGISYSRIGLIGGICGSPDLPVTYEFTDTMPLVNRTSYYRLVLGYLGYSSPKTLEFIRFNDKGYFLGPNPFNDHTRITFKNDENREYRLIITDMKGRQVMERMTTGHEFFIRREELEAGTYMFRLSASNQDAISGKIIAY